MARKSSAVSAASPVVTPKTFTLEIPLDAVIFTDKAGRTFTGQQSLDLLKGEVLKAVGYAASRKATLHRNKVREDSGVPASRIYANRNLPPEAAQIAQAFRDAVAAIVPTMAPKAPPAPKAAPVPSLEDAVAQELAQPTPAAPKAPKAPKARKAATLPEIVAERVQAASKRFPPPVQAAPVEVQVIPEGVTRASARKAAKAAKAVQALAPAATPAQVQAVVQAATPATQDAIISEAAKAATGSGILTNEEVIAFLKTNPKANTVDLKAAFPGRTIPAFNRFVALKAAAKA